jgi:hypothetical protein
MSFLCRADFAGSFSKSKHRLNANGLIKKGQSLRILLIMVLFSAQFGWPFLVNSLKMSTPKKAILMGIPFKHASVEGSHL